MKIKNYKIIDTDTNPKYIGKKLSLQEINKYNNGRKVKTNIIRKPRESKPPVWFQTWSDTIFIPFVKKTDARFEILENNDKAIFARLDKLEARIDKIEEKLEKNNIK